MGFSAEVLVDLYKSLGPNISGVEIGVCRGENIKQLLDACPNIAKLYGIDPWEAYKDKLTISANLANSWYSQATKLLHDYIVKERTSLIRGRSLDEVKKFLPETMDLVFIDGNHSFDAALADCKAWWPKVKAGGVLSGHDYRLKDHEVRLAVSEFAATKSLRVIDVQHLCWYIRKF